MALCILYNRGDNVNYLVKLINVLDNSGITHNNFIEYVKGTDLSSYKVVICVGNEITKKVLGAIKGNYAIIDKDDKYYLTLPSIEVMQNKDVKIRALNQIERAIGILIKGSFERPHVERIMLNSPDEVQDMVNDNLKYPFAFFDFETNNELIVHSDTFKITCLGLCFVPHIVYIIPEDVLYTIETVDALKGIFENPAMVKIAHNVSFDRKLLKYLTFEEQGVYLCTKLMGHRLDENRDNSLKSLVDIYIPEFSGYEYGVKYTDEGNEKLYTYLSYDCHCGMVLYCILFPMLVSDKLLYQAYRNLDMAGNFVLSNVLEYNGAYIDEEHYRTKSKEIEELLVTLVAELQDFIEVKGFIEAKNEEMILAEIDALNTKIEKRQEKYKETDSYIIRYKKESTVLHNRSIELYKEVNFNSPAQLMELLYTHRCGFKFKATKMSTDKEALQSIDHPIVKKLRVYRSLSKLKSTYYDGILEKTINGKIYASFNQSLTVTSRLSSSNPNLQNLPTRGNDLDDPFLSECVKGVKKGFIPPNDDWVVMQSDLSQAELRMIAHFSQDENMVQAYRDGIDLHAITGSRIADMTFEDFMKWENFKQYRQIAKSANFGIVFDISLEGYIDYVKINAGLIIDLETAKKHFEAVFGSYPRLKEWHKTYYNLAAKDGFVRTCFGIKRNLQYINSNDKYKKAEALRYAINNPIQGSIGNYTVWLIIWLYHRLDKNKALIFNTVHDSIILYVRKGYEKEIGLIIKNTAYDIPFTQYFSQEPLSLPLELDIEVGINYGETEEIKDFS